MIFRNKDYIRYLKKYCSIHLQQPCVYRRPLHGRVSGARAALVVDEAVPPPDTQPRAPQREEAVARTLLFFQEEEASAVFSKLESGGANRGVLDREQVMDRLGKIMGKDMSKSELLAAFEEMDIDGDGYVT